MKSGLRIAWSMAWGLMAVLLCVLWARSYLWYESVTSDKNPMNRRIVLASNSGVLETATYPANPGGSVWRYKRLRATRAEEKFHWQSMQTADGGKTIYLYVPHWLVLFAAIGMGTAPWFCSRFSLRTLLIATTLVAVGLGVIVWVIRS
jgi:hypothetical protein